MLAEIATGFGSLKAMKDILEGLNAANTQAQINDIKIAFQNRLFEAQSALAAAQAADADASQRIRDLEQQIVHFEHWESEKERYRLQAIDVRAFAYVLKPGMENGEAPHWLCQPCFENRKKSVLQYLTTGERAGNMGLQARWGCSVCHSTVSVFYQRNPATSWEPNAAN